MKISELINKVAEGVPNFKLDPKDIHDYIEAMLTLPYLTKHKMGKRAKNIFHRVFKEDSAGHLRWWYNPLNDTLYDATAEEHLGYMKKYPTIFGIKGGNIDSRDLIQLVSDTNWVRLTYNPSRQELGIMASKLKNATKAARKFNKQIGQEVKSIPVDIEDYSHITFIPDEKVSSFIKYGRI